MHARYSNLPAAAGPVGIRARSSETWRVPILLLAAFGVVWALLAIAPVSRSDWLLENLLVFITIPWLFLTRQRLRFSDFAYTCMFAFFVAHSIGAHFTYSLVPYDGWFQAWFGSDLSTLLGAQRNHYDRLVHFLYGLLLLPAAVELLARFAPPRGIWYWLMPVMFLNSHGVIYELMEWLTALIVAPSLGNAYLGTQGDPWDAQKDLALAALGAVLAMLIMGLTGKARPPHHRLDAALANDL